MSLLKLSLETNYTFEKKDDAHFHLASGLTYIETEYEDDFSLIEYRLFSMPCPRLKIL